MKGKIGVFDSGLGGLSVLKELIKVLPHEDFLFYEDSLHNPYGDKDEESLFEITSSIVDYLLKQNCKLIVIACNTATTSCIHKLREQYPNILFVGTVPAIKVAYDSHFQHTIILSTPYTTKSKRVQELLHDYTRDDQIVENVSGKNLAHLIELGKMDDVKRLLQELLSPYKNIADSLVLGCTHYSLIKPEICEVLPNISLLDGCVGVSQEVKRQLEFNHLINPSLEKGTLHIINNKDELLIERSYDILNSLSS